MSFVGEKIRVGGEYQGGQTHVLKKKSLKNTFEELFEPPIGLKTGGVWGSTSIFSLVDGFDGHCFMRLGQPPG